MNEQVLKRQIQQDNFYQQQLQNQPQLNLPQQINSSYPNSCQSQSQFYNNNSSSNSYFYQQQQQLLQLHQQQQQFQSNYLFQNNYSSSTISTMPNNNANFIIDNNNSNFQFTNINQNNLYQQNQNISCLNNNNGNGNISTIAGSEQSNNSLHIPTQQHQQLYSNNNQYFEFNSGVPNENGSTTNNFEKNFNENKQQKDTINNNSYIYSSSNNNNIISKNNIYQQNVYNSNPPSLQMAQENPSNNNFKQQQNNQQTIIQQQLQQKIKSTISTTKPTTTIINNDNNYNDIIINQPTTAQKNIVYEIVEKDLIDKTLENQQQQIELKTNSAEREKILLLQQQHQINKENHEKMFKKSFLVTAKINEPFPKAISLENWNFVGETTTKIYQTLNSRADFHKKSSFCRVLLVKKIFTWLVCHDKEYIKSHKTVDLVIAISDIINMIISLIELHRAPSSSILYLIIYSSDRFVDRTGINHHQIFNLLLTSAIVNLKFWNESLYIQNKTIADIFSFSVKDLNTMERRFLYGLDYNLCVTPDELNLFIEKLKKQSISSSYLK